MSGWKKFSMEIIANGTVIENLKKLAYEKNEDYCIYPDSLQEAGDSYFFIAMDEGIKVLIVLGDSDTFNLFKGKNIMLQSIMVKVCTLNNENCKVLRSIFPFTNPVCHQGIPITIGLGDRLGLASAGHIRLLKGKNVFPVLAQQSIRELNLTNRAYEDVLSAASWAVFQEGYTSGFGADGDHLKTAEEIKMALECGFTMITLDCSEHINNNISSLSNSEIDRLYEKIFEKDKQQLEAKYLGKSFKISKNKTIHFSEDEFKKTVLIYLEAIKYTIDTYNLVLQNYERNIDFEMSIDETLTSTSPESHFFVASELIAAHIKITSLAPRFCGEFQKGIDYRGDLKQFTDEFGIHAQIASYFGYKISVHSGSDKFSVFQIIGELTGGNYHLKTAGTNWLEAVRVIALKDPSLYRKMHTFALSNLIEAKKYYHITENIENIPDLSKVKDNELAGLMDLDDSRQVLHVTYGLLLNAKNPDGSMMFRDEIYALLNKYEDDYYKVLQKHIGKHLALLGIK